MARSRNVKPSFFDNENLAALSPHARLLFIGLWTLADCKGRMEDRPGRIRARIFPYEPTLDIDALLDELAAGPEQFIARYVAEGNRYLEVVNFSRHQNPCTKERQAGSRIPPRPIGDIPGTLPGRYGDVPESGRDVTGMNQGHDGDVPGTHPAMLITDSGFLITETKHPDPEPEASALRCLSNSVWEGDLFIQKAISHMNATNDPRFCSSTGWVSAYLRHMVPSLKQQRPDLTDDALLNQWRDAVDAAVQKNAWAASWIKKSFEGRVRNALAVITPETQKTHAHGSARGQSVNRWEILKTFTRLRHIATDEVFPVADITPVGDGATCVKFQGRTELCTAHLEGIEDIEASLPSQTEELQEAV